MNICIFLLLAALLDFNRLLSLTHTLTHSLSQYTLACLFSRVRRLALYPPFLRKIAWSISSRSIIINNIALHTLPLSSCTSRGRTHVALGNKRIHSHSLTFSRSFLLVSWQKRGKEREIIPDISLVLDWTHDGQLAYCEYLEWLC